VTGDYIANVLDGGAGNDVLKGGAGADTLDGGAGVDTVDYSDKTVAVIVTLSGATDATVTIGGVVEDTIRNIENVIGGAGADTLTGDDLPNALDGGAGNDTLAGGAGDDRLTGGVGADTFVIGASDGVETIIDLGTDDKIDFTGVDFSAGLRIEWRSTSNGAQTFALEDATISTVATFKLTGHFSETLFDLTDDGAGHARVGLLHEPQSLTRTQDFDRDGKSDILWQNTNGQAAVWQMDGTHLTRGAYVGSNPGPSWKAIGSGDFDGDGKSDILFQDTDGKVGIWLLDGTDVIGGLGTLVGPNPGTSWKAVATGDFGGDGRSDILFQHTNGALGIWQLDGTTIVATNAVGSNPGAAWKAVGTGDFNGDGKSDIVLRHDNGTVAVWELEGAHVTETGIAGAPGADWLIV